MSVPVITAATSQVTGIPLMAPPSGNTFPLGVRATAIQTVPAPTTAPTPSSPITLKMGQWILDPSGIYVLILENNLSIGGNQGLSLYRVIQGNPVTDGKFVGDNVYGPVGGSNGEYFLGQADGNACVYLQILCIRRGPQITALQAARSIFWCRRMRAS